MAVLSFDRRHLVPNHIFDVPVTGDGANLALWAALLLLSGAGVALLLVCRRRVG